MWAGGLECSICGRRVDVAGVFQGKYICDVCFQVFMQDRNNGNGENLVSNWAGPDIETRDTLSRIERELKATSSTMMKLMYSLAFQSQFLPNISIDGRNEQKDNARFCPHCGTSLPAVVTELPSEERAEAAPSPLVPSATAISSGTPRTREPYHQIRQLVEYLRSQQNGKRQATEG